MLWETRVALRETHPPHRPAGEDGPADAKNVEAARRQIQTLGLYGSVSVAPWDGRRLPYIENIVNLIVVSDPATVAKDELLRVLCHGGVAVFLNSKSEIQDLKSTKPRPPEIDEWTHYLHGPDNNAVAHDIVVGPPRHVQWPAEPLFARNHDRLAGISAMISQGGRLFYVVDDNAVPVVGLTPKWRRMARDAFNGVWLWERPIGAWANIERGFRSGPDQLPRLLVAAGGRVYAPLGFDQPVSALDAATGVTLRVYPETKGTEEVISRPELCRRVRESRSNAKRPERGPVFEISNPKSQIAEAGDWPTYRGDAARGGGTAAELPAALAPAHSPSHGRPSPRPPRPSRLATRSSFCQKPEQMCKEGLGFWSPSLPARPGDTYDISYHVRGRELNPSAGQAVAAFAEFSDATGRHRQRITLPAGPASDKSLTGTFAWTKLAATMNVPTGAKRMRVFLGLLPAQGQLLFDDVTIKVR